MAEVMSSGQSRELGTTYSDAQWPFFSVIICNYNYAQFVGDAIRSALNQDYPADRIEVIVADDGSTDGSRDVYAQFANDARVTVVLQENRGQTAAYATAVQRAGGDYICMLDSDDVFMPNKLRRVAQRIAETGEAPDNLFLCHDLVLEDITRAPPKRQSESWFEVVGVSTLGPQFTLAEEAMSYPFSIPCGLVFSRGVLAQCLEAIPAWAFVKGTDGIVCPSAFLKTGTVHYLKEQLGVYRIHATNDFASLVDGRFMPRFNFTTRAPKTFNFLSQWLDLLDKPPPERAVALDYLRRLEHLGRKPSVSRQLNEPVVSVALLGDSSQLPLYATPSVSLQSHPGVTFSTARSAAAPELLQMADTYASNQGEYIVFLRAGDRLDREFVERHLHWRQHGALVGVSCSDVRLASRTGSLVHADVMRNSGAWKQPLQQVPPLATGLGDWVAPPLSACLFRRTAFLDALFAQAAQMPLQLQQAGFWLTFNLQHHTGGVLRILETLGTCQLPDGAAASYGYLSAPPDETGALLVPPVALAAAWFAQFYATEQAMFRRWLPPAWHQRFGPWLSAQQKAATP
jgi:glycosyltransferase involved in cell wall biosynthesis